jgi:hypothetical protein
MTAGEVALGYPGLPAKSAATQGGVQLSDAALLHIGVGAEAGYDSNVFYAEDNPRGSAILRVVPFLELTNAARSGSINSDVFFDIGAALTYREYLSNDVDIRNQRAFMPSAYANLEFGKLQHLGFTLTEAFSRTEDPPYSRANALLSTAFVRDVNQASAGLRWAPGGGRLGAVLRYTNTLDFFETGSLKVANSMGHQLLFDASWKWLPKTALVLQVSQGYISYFNNDPLTGAKKPTSLPLHAMGGIRGLISAKLSLSLMAGYANGFYDTTRATPSGLRGNLSASADLNYRPTILTSVVLGYRHDFANAILGDWYYVDSVYLSIGQAIGGRFGLGLSARYDSRSFRNIPTMVGLAGRHDNYFQAGANLDYHMREWTYVGVAYTLMSNTSDAGPNDLESGRVNYFKQLVFARLGVTY